MGVEPIAFLFEPGFIGLEDSRIFGAYKVFNVTV